MDIATSGIRAAELTPGREGDSPVLPDLQDQIPEDEEFGTVTADGAYDTRRCHSAVVMRGATPFGHSLQPVAFVPSFPIRKNGRQWKEIAQLRSELSSTNGGQRLAPQRNLRATRLCGRAFWKRWTGYRARSGAEGGMPSPGSLEPVAFTGSTSRPPAGASPPFTIVTRSCPSGAIGSSPMGDGVPMAHPRPPKPASA